MIRFWLVVILVFSVLEIVFHVVALSLLFKVNIVNLSGSPKYLLISLCLTDFGFGMLFTVYHIGRIFSFPNKFQDLLLIFELTPFYLMYLSIMTLLTLDRFLEFRLNIKYLLIWSPKKTLIIFLCLNVCVYLYVFLWQFSYACCPSILKLKITRNTGLLAYMVQLLVFISFWKA